MTALPWTADLSTALSRRIEARRLSHALLISGPSGVGKQRLTEHVVASLLDMPAPQELAVAVQSAPDLMLVVPEEKKTTISIDQVRELGQWMTLSSHGPSGKVAVIVPAESMTIAAANALLKTLEEPVPERWLVLLSNEPSRLPATVLSRCERVAVEPPPPKAALEWLVSQGHEPKIAGEALAWTNGSPLDASSVISSGKMETLSRLREGLQGLLSRRGSRFELAGQLEGLEFAEILNALRKTAIELIRARNGVEMGITSDFSGYVIDLRGLFCYLDVLNKATRLQSGSFNVELMLENLLAPWTQGFSQAA
ncbi:MAG: hypothetical protein AAF578_12875 [Pseudomonadota bacterium]